MNEDLIPYASLVVLLVLIIGLAFLILYLAARDERRRQEQINQLLEEAVQAGDPYLAKVAHEMRS